MVRRRVRRSPCAALAVASAVVVAAAAGAGAATAAAAVGRGPGPRYAGTDPDTETYTTSWDSSPFNLESVTDNNLGLMAKFCSEQFCHAGINGLDLWISFEEVRCVVGRRFHDAFIFLSSRYFALYLVLTKISRCKNVYPRGRGQRVHEREKARDTRVISGCVAFLLTQHCWRDVRDAGGDRSTAGTRRVFTLSNPQTTARKTSPGWEEPRT